MGYTKQLAIEAADKELASSSYFNEDLYMETQWWEAHERDEAREVAKIMEEDALKHFDLVDSTDGK